MARYLMEIYFAELESRLQKTQELLEQKLQSVPSALSEERQTNPFLRLGEPQVKQAAEKYVGKALTEGVEVFTAIRNWKDREYD